MTNDYPPADLEFFSSLAETVEPAITFNVPAWGRTVRLLRLDATQVVECTAAGNLILVARELLVRCLVDQADKPIFSDRETGLKMIAAWDPDFQVQIGTKALEINGLSSKGLGNGQLSEVKKKD